MSVDRKAFKTAVREASDGTKNQLLFSYMIACHVKILWTSMHNSAYNCDFKNLIAPLNSLGTLEIYQVIKTAN